MSSENKSNRPHLRLPCESVVQDFKMCVCVCVFVFLDVLSDGLLRLQLSAMDHRSADPPSEYLTAAHSTMFSNGFHVSAERFQRKEVSCTDTHTHTHTHTHTEDSLYNEFLLLKVHIDICAAELARWKCSVSAPSVLLCAVASGVKPQ